MGERSKSSGRPKASTRARDWGARSAQSWRLSSIREAAWPVLRSPVNQSHTVTLMLSELGLNSANEHNVPTTYTYCINTKGILTKIK